MCDEHAQHMVEMFAIEDQEPIQTFRANCPHEPLRDAVRLRRTKGRENDLYPFGLKDPVNTLGELLIPVANQVAEFFRPLRQGPRQLPGLLRDPRPVRIGCAAGEVHPTSAELDEAVATRPSPR